jgi:hypothetical protein
VWPVQIADALRELIGQANLARDQHLPAIAPDIRDALLTRFRNGVLVGLSDTTSAPTRPASPKPGCCWKSCATAPRTCCASPTTCRCPPPRIRPNATYDPARSKQKISGGLTSVKRTEDRYTILGCLSTATKHGLDKITVLRDALTGRPWIPAQPAPT